MAKPAVGDVVLVTFPFSDLQSSKLRPALVVAIAEFNNVVLCQITSKPYTSKIAVKLEETDFSKGELPVTSFVRPDKIFTADPSLVVRAAGSLQKKKLGQILNVIQGIFAPE